LASLHVELAKVLGSMEICDFLLFSPQGISFSFAMLISLFVRVLRSSNAIACCFHFIGFDTLNKAIFCRPNPITKHLPLNKTSNYENYHLNLMVATLLNMVALTIFEQLELETNKF